jgi:hypothetical protein
VGDRWTRRRGQWSGDGGRLKAGEVEGELLELGGEAIAFPSSVGYEVASFEVLPFLHFQVVRIGHRDGDSEALGSVGG